MQADLKPSGWDFAKQSQSRTAPSAVLIAGFGVVFGLAFVSVAYWQEIVEETCERRGSACFRTELNACTLTFYLHRVTC